MEPKIILHDNFTRSWLQFDGHCATHSACEASQVQGVLETVQAEVDQHGRMAAGFLSYEAAPAFDEALEVKRLDGFPLIWFGLFENARSIHLPSPDPNQPDWGAGWQPDVTKHQYVAALASIKELIASGDTYQVNYTMRQKRSFDLDPWQLFLHLSHSRQARFGAYLETDEFAVCSASPELFFLLNEGQLEARPMKGTAPRGVTLADDNAQAEWLHHSVKNRAENIMIVDMVRNDMGRIARTGSVHVAALYDVEKYSTLWQMTSTVKAEADTNAALILPALFPCASITGAPKPRTMQIIAQLEKSPRRIYTGSIGYIAPGNKAQFNVAIRTVLVDKRNRTAEYGVGGGIVWDSQTENEYEECEVKTRVLSQKRPEFELLETILWSPEEWFFLLPYHLQRMEDSAAYFEFDFNKTTVTKALEDRAADLEAKPHRVRLLLNRSGQARTEAYPLAGADKNPPVRLRLAGNPVNSGDPFLYHKTTHRKVYDNAKAQVEDCDDVLLWNQGREVTETTIANLLVEKDGQLFTPAVTCGLLAGTYRQWMMDQLLVKARRISIEELKQADKLYVINSVRKQQEAILMD